MAEVVSLEHKRVKQVYQKIYIEGWNVQLVRERAAAE